MLDDVVGSQLADSLTPITELDYGRCAPTLPDRTAKASPAQNAAPPSAPARRTQ